MDNKDVIAVLWKAVEYLRTYDGSMLEDASAEREERARAEAVLRIEGLISALQEQGEGMTPAELMMKIVAEDSDERKRRMEKQLKEIREAMNEKKRRRKGDTQKE